MIEHLTKVALFEQLTLEELQTLQHQSQVHRYLKGEIVLHEGDRLPTKLHALINGKLQVKKTSTNGRETLLRILMAGDIFAAPALFGDGVSPATILAETNCEVLLIEKAALLMTIQQNPEVAIRILVTLTQRLNQLHQTIHGLVSERAIVRLAHLIQSTAAHYGTKPSSAGNRLNVTLSHYPKYRTKNLEPARNHSFSA
ncbi:Crp/Fnr family transcriptional regulator, partial [Phormidesmis sp. 146-12]